MGAATGNRDGLNRNLYEEICLLCVACGEKMRERACRVGGAKPAAGVCVPKGAVARWTSRSVGRRVPQRSRRHAIIYKLNRAPRYHRPRASACRRVPALDGHRGRPPKDAAMIETTRHYKLNRAPRYHRPRASACRRAPPAEWTSRSAAAGCRNDRASAPSRYGKRGRERSGRRCGEATT